MDEITPNSFPSLLEKYLDAMNRFYPSTIQLVILSYLAAQADPIPQFYILQKLQRIYPKHSEKMLFNELSELGLKKIIRFDSDLKYWFDAKYINAEVEGVFRAMEAELTKANLDENIISHFTQMKRNVLSLQANILEIMPTFYQTRNKDLKKFFRNIIRKYGLDSIYTAFEQQTVGKSIDFLALSESLARELTQQATEIPPTISAPIGRNTYNANRKVKQYNETAKGTRLFFYSDKKSDAATTDNTPTVYKESIVFGVPRIGEHIPKSPKAKPKKKKAKGNEQIPVKDHSFTIDPVSANNDENNPPKDNLFPQITTVPSLITPEVKRRGRPPKNPEVPLKEREYANLDILPPRPRGRPPKPKEIDETKEEHLSPRPRGRPPKPKDIEITPIDALPSRPRGRPPKHMDK